MNYKAIQTKAYNKIKQYGSKCVIKRISEEVYNPATNEYEGGETLISGFALQSSFDMENVNGTTIKAGDIILMCVFDNEPKVGDILQFTDKEYKAVNIATSSPDGKTKMYYKIQAR